METKFTFENDHFPSQKDDPNREIGKELSEELAPCFLWLLAKHYEDFKKQPPSINSKNNDCVLKENSFRQDYRNFVDSLRKKYFLGKNIFFWESIEIFILILL